MGSGKGCEGQKLQAGPHASQAEDSWTSSLDCWSRWTSESKTTGYKIKQLNIINPRDYKITVAKWKAQLLKVCQ